MHGAVPLPIFSENTGEEKIKCSKIPFGTAIAELLESVSKWTCKEDFNYGKIKCKNRIYAGCG